VKPSEIKAHIESLSDYEKQRLFSALRGMSIITLAAFVGQTFNVDTANELTSDANYVLNYEKLEYKMVPSIFRTIYDLIKTLFA
jgi:hypothetical protein